MLDFSHPRLPLSLRRDAPSYKWETTTYSTSPDSATISRDGRKHTITMSIRSLDRSRIKDMKVFVRTTEGIIGWTWERHEPPQDGITSFHHESISASYTHPSLKHMSTHDSEVVVDEGSSSIIFRYEVSDDYDEGEDSEVFVPSKIQVDVT